MKGLGYCTMKQHRKMNLWLAFALAGSLYLPSGQPASGIMARAEAAGQDVGQEYTAQTDVKDNARGEDKAQAGTKDAGKPGTSNVPVKPEPVRKVREVDFKVQHGQLISEAIGDVDGDGIDEIIELMGNPVVEKSSYMGDMYIVAREAGAANPAKVKYFYRPKNLGGYNAYITLADVTGNGFPNLIIAAPSGGSSGVTDYRILDFSDTQPEEIFKASDNKGVNMVGEYLPGFKAKLTFPLLDQDIVLDLDNQKEVYRNLNVYNSDGELKESGLRPTIQNLSRLSSLDVNGDGMEELVTVQKVLGVINADPLGSVRTVWEYRAGVWQPRNVGFQAELYTKPTYDDMEKTTGAGGYEITALKVATDTGAVEYPHFQKMDGKIAWKINNTIETFVRSHLRDAVFGTRLNLAYEVKYAGKNYASIMVVGLLSDRDRSEGITKCFNFNLKTGEELPLKGLLKPWGRFWKLVAKETKDKGLSVTEKNVNDYYYDGEVLGLLYGDRKEYALEHDKVVKYMEKNKAGEEFLTSQSNEDSKSKTEKK